MPYVAQEDRRKYEAIVLAIDLLPEICSKGDLEYLVFKLAKKFMKTRESRYSTLHDATYALQHASDEFRRRFLDERENFALSQNGDIYG